MDIEGNDGLDCVGGLIKEEETAIVRAEIDKRFCLGVIMEGLEGRNRRVTSKTDQRKNGFSILCGEVDDQMAVVFGFSTMSDNSITSLEKLIGEMVIRTHKEIVL